MDPQQAQQQAMHMALAILPFMLLVGLTMIAFFVFLFWRIFVKAGMAGPLSLLILLWPIGLIVVLCILAFSDWKVAPVPQLLAYPPQYPPPPAYPPPAPPAPEA